MALRDLILAIVPKETAKRMEEDSKCWFVKCAPCGQMTSFWDLGGIRYKAVGRPRVFLKCQICGERSWHTVERKEPTGFASK